MISTITTTASVGAGVATTAVLIAVSTVLLLLVCKQSVLTNAHTWSERLRRILTVSIAPLLIVFVINAVLHVVAVLK